MAKKDFTWDCVDDIYNTLDTLQDDGFAFTSKDEFDSNGWLRVGEFYPYGKHVARDVDGFTSDIVKRGRIQLWVEDTNTCSLYIGTSVLSRLNLKNIRRLAKYEKQDKRLFPDVEIHLDFGNLTDTLTLLAQIRDNLNRVKVAPKVDTEQKAS